MSKFDISRLKIKEVEKLPEYCQKQKNTIRGELSKLLLAAPMDKWIRLTGFENVHELRRTQTNIRGTMLKELSGVVIKTASATDKLELFFLKKNKQDDQNKETKKRNPLFDGQNWIYFPENEIKTPRSGHVVK